MKYMGAKTRLLRGELGPRLVAAARGRARFVDLFAGSAAVTWHVASRCSVPVVACDLQSYSKVLAEAVLLRTGPIESWEPFDSWLSGAAGLLADGDLASTIVSGEAMLSPADIYRAREASSLSDDALVRHSRRGVERFRHRHANKQIATAPDTPSRQCSGRADWQLRTLRLR